MEPSPDRIEIMRRDLPFIVIGWPLVTRALLIYALDLGLAYASGAISEREFREAVRTVPDRSQ